MSGVLDAVAGKLVGELVKTLGKGKLVLYGVLSYPEPIQVGADSHTIATKRHLCHGRAPCMCSAEASLWMLRVHVHAQLDALDLLSSGATIETFRLGTWIAQPAKGAILQHVLELLQQKIIQPSPARAPALDTCPFMGVAGSNIMRQHHAPQHCAG